MPSSNDGSVGLFNSVTLSTISLDYIFTTGPTEVLNLATMTTENCSQLNDILWEYRRDATTLPFVIALFVIIYFIIIVFGVIGNMCVILAIARTK